MEGQGRLTKALMNNDSTWSVKDAVKEPGRIRKRTVMSTQLVMNRARFRRAKATPMPSSQGAL